MHTHTACTGFAMHVPACALTSGNTNYICVLVTTNVIHNHCAHFCGTTIVYCDGHSEVVVVVSGCNDFHGRSSLRESTSQ